MHLKGEAAGKKRIMAKLNLSEMKASQADRAMMTTHPNEQSH